MYLLLYYFTYFLVETESATHFINDFLAYLVDSYGAYGFRIHILNLYSLHILFKSIALPVYYFKHICDICKLCR